MQRKHDRCLLICIIASCPLIIIFPREYHCTFLIASVQTAAAAATESAASLRCVQTAIHSPPPHSVTLMANPFRSPGNIYKMSRNKDKYENSNPRRQAVYLSPEDIAAGRIPQWHGIEITGNVRNLSPSLWQFQHLTQMYLSDNKLVRLPPEVGQLVNLRTLDVSSNKLRSLPGEIGELIHLR